MTEVLPPQLQRTRSLDGTEIGYFASGQGPPLVLVHGILSDHSRFGPLLPFLEPHTTIFAMDRRGRGASGDHAEYDAFREFEDIAVLVDSVADATGGAVTLYGHSSGAALALNAAMLTPHVRRLVLYEPAISGANLFPAGLPERLEALLAQGDREAVVETFCREVLRFTDEQLEAFRAQPSWPARVAAAHTLPREMRIPPEQLFRPERAANIAVPVLILQGADSPAGFKADAETVRASLPDARIAVLDGEGHSGDIFAPREAAGALLAFLGEERRP